MCSPPDPRHPPKTQISRGNADFSSLPNPCSGGPRSKDENWSDKSIHTERSFICPAIFWRTIGQSAVLRRPSVDVTLRKGGISELLP